MKHFLLVLVLIFSSSDLWAAKKKVRKGNPTKEAGRIFERGLKAQKAGDLQQAKKIFIRVEKNYPKVTLNDEHESDVESYGVPNVTNYGEYAAHLLKFVNLEIKEGASRTFKTSEDAMTGLIKEIKAEDKAQLEKSLWVEVDVHKCETQGVAKVPQEAVEVLFEKIKGNGKSLKATEIFGSDPALILEISSRQYVKVGLSPHNGGWIWDQVTECDRRPN